MANPDITSIPGLNLPKVFFDLAKKWGIFDLNAANAPSFEELDIEDQISMLESEYARQMESSQADEDTEGSMFSNPEMQQDYQQMLQMLQEQLPVEDFSNPLEGELALTDNEYPLLTEGQVGALKDATQEVYRRVDAGEYTWDDARDAIGKVLDYVGIPYDADSLRVEGGGISDNEGLISNRYEVTDNPEDAVAGGGGGDMSAADILGEVGAPGGPTGGDDSQLGDEEQWVYVGNGVFRHKNGTERFDPQAAQNPAYVPGETYSGPDPTTEPGTVAPGDNGGFWDGVVWRPSPDWSDYTGADVLGGTSPTGTEPGTDIPGVDPSLDPTLDPTVDPDITPGVDPDVIPGTDGTVTDGGGGGTNTPLQPGMLTGAPRVRDILAPRPKLDLDNIPDLMLGLLRSRRRR